MNVTDRAMEVAGKCFACESHKVGSTKHGITVVCTKTGEPVTGKNFKTCKTNTVTTTTKSGVRRE